MKKIWTTHVIATIAFVVFGVLAIASASPPPRPAPTPAPRPAPAPATSRNTNRWMSFTIEPSRVRDGVNNPGNTIMWHRLGDGTRMEVFFDPNLSFEDQVFFYHRLLQDFGWRRSNDGRHWEAAGSARRPTSGTTYVNPARRMAVFIMIPDGYVSLRVRFAQ